jgi:spore coat polysaccharide biosynthesis predicted glycosyltransferase SpsG
VLAVIDGDDRSIAADLFLDHNIGAEDLPWPERVRAHMLAGSRFALVRHSIVDARREKPWLFEANRPHVVAVMGGSDPTGTIVPVTQALGALNCPITATVITAPAWKKDVEAVIGNHENIRVITPTPNLPELLSRADLAISAAGTSSWELCTLGIPSVLIGVVENQRKGLRELTERGLVWGINPTSMNKEELIGATMAALNTLLTDARLRQKMSESCLETFDGMGPRRVVDALAETISQTDAFLPSDLRG